MGTMWVRSGFWTGTPRSGCTAQFRRQVDGVLVPALQALPHVRSAGALWPRHLEDGAPRIACQIVLVFDDRAALERMFESPERKALRPLIADAMALFDGVISHIDSEATIP